MLGRLKRALAGIVDAFASDHGDSGLGVSFGAPRFGRPGTLDDETRKRLPYFYRCAREDCGREIRLARVYQMSLVHKQTNTGKQRYIRIRYSCTCSKRPLEWDYRATTEADSKALVRLIWPFKVRLPYRAADFGEQVPCPDEDDEAAAVRFAWECEQLDDVGEFLLFCGDEPVEPLVVDDDDEAGDE
jgi:hypothetical protein